MKQIKLVGITGTRVVGKDTLFSLLYELSPNFARVSFADEIKTMLGSVSNGLFGKNEWNLSPEEKESMRPLYIQVAQMGLDKDKNFWAAKVESLIGYYIYKGKIPIITDLRHPWEYEFYKKIYGDAMIVINVTREGAPEPTENERIYGPLVAMKADYHLNWLTDSTHVLLRPLVKELFEQIFNKP
jgi:hypothetical protein